MEHLHFGSRLLRPPLQSVLVRGADERPEQRMRLQRLRLELGMELASDEVGMVRQLHHLDVSSVRRRSGNPQAARGQRFFVLAVEFVAVAMTLADFELAVDLVGQRVRARSCRSRRPVAWCRPVLPPRAVRAACRSRGAALRDRIRWSWRPPVRRRCAQTRCRPSACPGKCRNTGPCFRGRSGWQSACPRCRACRSRPAPAVRRSRPVVLRRCGRRLRALRLRSSSDSASGCGPARRGPAPLSTTCRNLRTRRTCRRSRS